MNMKKLMSILTAMVIGATVLSPAAFAASPATTVQVQEAEKSIHVRGEGKISVVADMGIITVGVQTEDAKSDMAQKKNAEAMSKVMAELKSQKISDKDIKTTSFNIYPRTKYNEKTQEYDTVGYTATNMVQVTIRNIDIMGKVIDAVGKNGANRIESIAFTTSKADELYLQALEQAVKNGTKKAQILAKAANLKITTPFMINELSNGYAPLFERANYEMAKAEAMDTTTPISKGEVEITASVDLEFR